MTDWFTDLETTYAQLWSRIHGALEDRASPVRQMVMATAGLAGGAEARSLILRGADPAQRRLEFHTDAASTKVRELSADPRASVLVWDPAASLQIRLSVQVTLSPADKASWDAIPDAARGVYGGHPPPGTPIATPDTWLATPRQERCLLLACHASDIETLHIGPDRQRRARFNVGNDWAGTWVAP